MTAFFEPRSSGRVPRVRGVAKVGVGPSGSRRDSLDEAFKARDDSHVTHLGMGSTHLGEGGGPFGGLGWPLAGWQGVHYVAPHARSAEPANAARPRGRSGAGRAYRADDFGVGQSAAADLTRGGGRGSGACEPAACGCPAGAFSRAAPACGADGAASGRKAIVPCGSPGWKVG